MYVLNCVKTVYQVIKTKVNLCVPALQIIQTFYNKTYYERAGGNWTDVQQAEACNENNSNSSNTTTTAPNLSNVSNCYEKFGVQTELLLNKWQLEILWSVTVALFVFFGMIGAFSSAKVADFFGRWVLFIGVIRNHALTAVVVVKDLKCNIFIQSNCK